MSIQVSSSSVLEPQITGDRATYLAKLLGDRLPLSTHFSAESKTWLESIRSQAADRVVTLEIPSTRDEEWRFTDLSALLSTPFVPGTAPALGLSEIQPYLLPEAAHSCLVFVNGVYAPALSDVTELPAEIKISSLADVLHDATWVSRLQPYLATQPGADDVFTALNTASLTDAALVWIPKNQAIAPPIHLLLISTAGTTASIHQPRCLVVAESGSSVTLVEDYVALDASGYWTNSVTEVWLEANAQVNHSRIQRESLAAIHIGKTAVSQARDSRYTCNSISIGATLSRHNLELYQTGEQTETHLNGLTLVKGEQVADTHSAIAFSKPYGTSRQLHKCIADDKAHAVFNGKVFVPKAAQLTDAGQLNQNLLLSSKARIDTKPQLEIVADNVKCTHGATVGQLDTDAMFYLQSRGIDPENSRKLLVYAFAYEVIDQIAIASLRKTLADQLTANS